MEIYFELKNLQKKNNLDNIEKRIRALKSLRIALKENEEAIYKALFLDLKKNKYESYLYELFQIYKEIDYFIKNINKLTQKIEIKVPLIFKPGNAHIEHIPKGLVLIISPWNYPFQLSFLPLIAAIAAGNAVLLKPSEISHRSSIVIKKIIEDAFSKDFPIKVLLGGKEEVIKILEHPFDHIFYTGSTLVGKEIMKKAAQFLTPVTLELGGKSPVFIDETSNLKIAAKRIMWAKSLNQGQTCVAPDYVLIKKDMINSFVSEAKIYLENHGSDAKIINIFHTERLISYLKDGEILLGGLFKPNEQYIEPTLITNIDEKSPLLHEEIFGPILPLITYEHVDEALDFINKRSNPLVIYLFSTNKETINIFKKHTKSGAICQNDCLSYLGINDLPFKGVGLSGMGSYHGAFGFYEFSHKRPFYERSYLLDLSLKYPPYKEKNFSLIKTLLG